MKIYVNGEACDADGNSSLAELVESLQVAQERIAVELNKNVIRRRDWRDTPVNEGDRIEIVHFVGGG